MISNYGALAGAQVGATASLRKLFAPVLVGALVLSSVAAIARGQDSTVRHSPPVAPVRPVTDDYFGTKVVDNYRWMENLKDAEMERWMKGQADYTQSVLAKIPARQRLLARISELDASLREVVENVWRLPGNRYFYLKRSGNADVAKLYARVGLGGKERLLVDPGTIPLAPQNRGKGPSTIQDVSISDDGRYLAVGITPGGAELDAELHVIETSSGKETGDAILRTPGGGSPQWLPDNHSFLYHHLQDLPAGAPVTEVELKVRTYRHVLGTDAAQDRAVFGYGVLPSINVDSTHWASVVTQPGWRYALGFVNDGVSPNIEVYIASMDAISKSDSAWRKIAAFSDQVKDATLRGDDVYLLTFKDASHYKIVRTDARHPDLAAAEVVVPASDAIIQHMAVAGDALYVQLLDGSTDRLLRVPFGPHPAVESVALPFAGTVSVKADPRVPGALLNVGTWTNAGELDAYDPQTGRVSNTRLQPQGPNDNPSSIESVEVKVRSYDGTMVPLSIVYPKGLKLDGSHPLLLSGYGAYGFPDPASFLATEMAEFERGAVMATCHVRGGGEYGEEWHLAGKGATKPNTWRDFIACAEYLVAKGYTSPAHLAGEGGSAGGILIGRAIEERPDLFAVALADVPISDMLRFETSANGVPNIPEFGSTKTEEGFRALYAMSAYANVRDGVKYPAVMVTTGINDPRVDPWVPAKFAARLQAATASGKPVLLRVDYHAGHGYGSTEAQWNELDADIWSFVFWQTGDPAFQPSHL